MIEFKVLMNACLTIQSKLIVCNYDEDPTNSKFWVNFGKTPKVTVTSGNGFSKDSNLKISNQKLLGNKKFTVTIMVPDI